MNTKSLLLAGLLSVAPVVVFACDCDKAQAPVTEEVATVVAPQAPETAKKAVVAQETKEVSVQEVVAETAPANN